jgi:5-methylcytosine-specific restriction enzyme subunit McrC
MRSCDKIYSITEYEGFSRGAAKHHYQGLPEKTFDALEKFILANKSHDETEAVELLSLSARRGVGKVITARNYVGIITMEDGTTIEILPKIAGDNISIDETKRIFLDMLKTLKDVTFKDFNFSNLHTNRSNVFDIFIKMFLDEIFLLTKQGLKAAYIPIENNEHFYKGKLLASQNIKYNIVHHERFVVRYDDFNINRPENRLIKSTLSFLLRITNDDRNSQNAARLLTFFESVEYSKSYDSDFSKCFIDRGMNHYDRILSWCRVFLKGNSFTAFAGSEVALALLFPMEKIFESFIASKIRKHIGNDVTLRTQDNRYSLFDKPSRAFTLRPDIVLEAHGEIFVLDTKWKLLSENSRNNGISQADMYQMYAYSKKYDAKKIVLIYPCSDLVNQNDISYTSNDNVKVDISFIDLRNVDNDIEDLIAKLFNVEE